MNELAIAVGVAVIASGWWGRWELPVVLAPVTGGLLNGLPDTHVSSYAAFQVAAAGAFLAYLRQPAVIEECRKRGKEWRSFW